MDITIILCTYNRCKSLAIALGSAAALVVSESVQWEVLVVDNNSSDRTREVVEEFSARFPGRFRYLFEPKAGKSNALNAGIERANGKVLAFMDDDVRLDPAWLDQLTAHLRTGEWAGAGGRIIPEWSRPRPAWLPRAGRYALAPLVSFDRGDEPGPLLEAPFGANMAFRKSVFERYGGFRTDLGPRPGSELRNEDLELGTRLLDAGEKLRYEPGAVVYHPITEARVQKRYFLKWNFDHGRGKVRQSRSQYPDPDELQVFSAPLTLLCKLMIWLPLWLLTAGTRKRFERKLKVWTLAGAIWEVYRRRTAAISRARHRSGEAGTPEPQGVSRRPPTPGIEIGR